MLKREAAKRLLSQPQVRSAATDLALKLGSLAILRGAHRLIPGSEVRAKPTKKARLATLAAPVVAVIGAAAIGRLLYKRSEQRRQRLSERAKG